jgi:hypothetical protein
MTGTDYTLFTHKSVPVIFEPPCIWVKKKLTKPKTFGFQSFTDFAITDKGLHYCHRQRRTKGGPTAQLPGRLRRRWNNLKYGATKLRCPHEKEYLRKLSAIWVRDVKNVRQPCPRPKKFKEYRFEGAPNY